MEKLVSYRSFDYLPADPVPVIASFDTEGHIVPLYVRLQGDACKVDSYWFSDKYAGITEYHCKIKDGGYLRALLLTYYHTERIWTIPRH